MTTRTKSNNCDKPWCPNTNYHGYHAIDYYGVENHFGTMEDLLEMIREWHRNGIKVIQDQVANHVGVQTSVVKKSAARKLVFARIRRTLLTIRFCFRRTLRRLKKTIS